MAAGHTWLALSCAVGHRAPIGHAIGALDAGGQKLPAGHCRCCAFVDPVGQKKPAAHGPATALRLGASQNEPAVQLVGSAEPCGQKAPIVHGICALNVEPGGQKDRGAHGPLTTARPDVAQNEPAGHAVGVESAVTGQKLPIVHGVTTALPSGQKLPRVHAFWRGSAEPAVQK